jgi:hypothetical protein
VLVAMLAAGCAVAESETDLDQLVPPFRARGRALQVVIHDVVESAPRGGAVRVCRALADTPIQLRTETPLPLREILERLAREVESDMIEAARAASGAALPTLRCPSGAGDHLVIGEPPP